MTTAYDAAKQTLTLTATQRTPPTPGQPEKQPVMIPLRVGLLGPDGRDLPLRLQGGGEDLGTETVLRCDKETNTFVFTGAPPPRRRPSFVCVLRLRFAVAVAAALFVALSDPSSCIAPSLPLRALLRRQFSNARQRGDCACAAAHKRTQNPQSLHT